VNRQTIPDWNPPPSAALEAHKISRLQEIIEGVRELTQRLENNNGHMANKLDWLMGPVPPSTAAGGHEGNQIDGIIPDLIQCLSRLDDAVAQSVVISERLQEL